MKTALSRMVGRARMLGAWPPERQFGLGFASKPLINYIRAAVHEGLEQAERGEGRPATEVFAQLRAKHGIPG